METMLYPVGTVIGGERSNARARIVRPDTWRAALPTLTVPGATLRELRRSDARSLFALLTTVDVSRFISPPPATVEGFDTFIAWAQKKRAAGEYLCFGIVPDGHDEAVGILQIQMPDGQSAEWGFALGSPFWGTGLFPAGANAVIDFAFERIGVSQLGARAMVDNHRGSGALRKMGAVREGLLPGAFERDGRAHDQYYWTLTPDDRPRRKIVWEEPLH
jgi:ribosomal-protein-alanine N-acetyltransferase